MKSIINHLTCTLVLFGLVACNTTPSKPNSSSKKTFDAPEWVTNIPSKSGIAYGTGSADVWGDKNDAIRRAGEAARVNLVSQLRVTISGTSSSDIEERKATGKQTELVQTLRNTIRSSVPAVELDEVVISDSYVEEKFAYALAELDRQKAASRLRSQISSLEDEVVAISKRPRQGSTLQQVRVLLPALKVFAKRDRLADQLALVSTQRKKPALNEELAAIQTEIFSLFDQLQIQISMKNRGAEEIAGGVIESLTEQGLRVNSQGSYDLMIEVSANLKAVEKENTHYVFADSRVTIKDDGDRILSTFSRQAKGASGYEELAQSKAEKSVAKMLADELAQTLVDKIN